jgi:uncharacterized protein (TIGR02996 family)
MTPQESLFQAILNDPDDNDLRLVYADWLEDHGDSSRAEFIRVQIALAQLPPEDSGRPALEERERRLLSAHRDEWLPQPLRDAGGEPSFRRGFVDHLRIDAPVFLARADALFQWPLLRSVAFGALQDVTALADSPHLARLAELDVRGFDSKYPVYIFVQPGDALRFFASPHLRGLRALRLGYCGCGLVVAQALARSPHLAGLTALELSDTDIGDEGPRALVDSPHLARLTHLDLSRSSIGAAGVLALAASPRMVRRRVRRRCGCCYLGEEAIQALSDSPTLAALEELDLRNCWGDRDRERLRARFGPRLRV